MDTFCGAKTPASVTRVSRVRVMESHEQFIKKCGRGRVAVRQRHRDFVALADMAHIDGVRASDVLRVHTAGQHDLAALCRQ